MAITSFETVPIALTGVLQAPVTPMLAVVTTTGSPTTATVGLLFPTHG